MICKISIAGLLIYKTGHHQRIVISEFFNLDFSTLYISQIIPITRIMSCSTQVQDEIDCQNIYESYLGPVS